MDGYGVHMHILLSIVLYAFQIFYASVIAYNYIGTRTITKDESGQLQHHQPQV